ncbi:type I-D CRISPR-associated helicase Cas3' [Methanocalculus sp.]|uniref:type I-D CRISPR-associated helicase Cas3' n=1 Tax=Methanocalculus sp. TaxID=2004547 RepID=UPI002615279E|nr:type I-D CRISPR-associated helicase Cas3' [Methanocalculus sp.]MDG6249260.1 type I-D CRISPR-associated helicase Cas3' [Methanocalculus sp.]
MIVEGLSIPRYNTEPLFDSLLPYGHQVIARETIQNLDNFFLFLTAPTGSGKTDSWAIPALFGDLGVVIALYPTNALAEDQFRTITALRDHLGSQTRVEFVTANTLGIMRDSSETPRMTRGDILEDLLRSMFRSGSGIVVTNPDIFVYALKGYYYNGYLPSAVKNFLKTVIFDEFHLYDLRQRDLILFILHDLLLSNAVNMQKFIFLSATPEHSILAKIRDIIGVQPIVADARCDYPVVDERLILPEVDLEFLHGLRFRSGEHFIQHLDDFLSFKEDFRTAVILDSAIEVALVSEILRNNTHFKICEVSGFRKDPITESFDILVGNKAVEVGIDFKGNSAIQRLVFSAYTVSEFLQRFGRLRNPKSDVHYKAICYAPDEAVRHFSCLERISRQQLEGDLRRTMQDPRVFDNFRWRYGYLEAFEFIYRKATGIGAHEARLMKHHRAYPPLKGGLPSDIRYEYLRQRCDLIYAHYLGDAGVSPADAKTLLIPLEEMSDTHLDIIDELRNFRGSELSLAYYQTSSETIGTYSLFFLLRWADMEIVDKKTFLGRIPDHQRKEVDGFSDRIVGYAIIYGMNPNPRRVSLDGARPNQMDCEDTLRIPEMMFGIHPVIRQRSEDDRLLDLTDVSKTIRKKGIFCRYVSHSGFQSKRLYDLDDYTMLINFKDGSLALGLDALYADCAVYEFNRKRGIE